jgi:hypothetical protein
LWPNPPEILAESQTYTGSGTSSSFLANTRTVYLFAGGPLTIQGIFAGYHGQRVTFIQASPSAQVDFIDASSAALAPDRLYNWAQSGPTSLALGGACRGHVTYLYDAAIPGWRLVSHEQGGWITPAYNAADYYANAGGGWAPGGAALGRCAYYLQGRVLFFQLFVYGGTITGSPTVLSRKLPVGFTSTGGASGRVVVTDTASDPQYATSSGTTIDFGKDFFNQAAWVATAGGQYLRVQAAIDVN